MKSLDNKIALVTGSSRGIGREIAVKVADVISGIAVHYMSDRAAAQEVVKKIRKRGKQAECFRADLTKERQASAMVRKVEEKLGKVDILVNNFGPILVKSWEKVTSSEWDFVLNGNLASALFCLKAVLPSMRKRKWGRIINLGYSRAEQLVAFSTITPYAIAKTGLLILTRTVSASESERGITVNMVSPGLIEGGILPKDKSISEKKLGKFENVADAVLFLISEQAGFITGANLIVAGGWKI